jgi:uncharacterized peroxidase-related enzyme
MSRLTIPTEPSPEVQPVFDAVNGQFGVVPNVIQMMSISPTVLMAVTTFQGTMGTVLDMETRNAIALAVSEVDECTYCRNLHAHLAVRFASSSEEEIEMNRQGESSDAKVAAAATFGARVVETRGNVTDEELAAVRAAGFDDAGILEIVGWAVAVLSTNFINNVAATEVDLSPATVPGAAA